MFRTSVARYAWSLCLALAAPAAAAPIDFSFSGTGFSYVTTDPFAGPGGVIGTITLATTPISGVVVSDGLSSTSATPGTTFNLSLSAHVVKGAAPNVYSLSGGQLTATDTTGVTKLAASFASSDIAIAPVGGVSIFMFGAPLVILGANDALLVNGPGDDWAFVGNQPAPYAPSVTLAAGRSLFDTGLVGELHVEPGIFADLDTFFGAGQALPVTRGTMAADLKITVIPEPASLLFMLVGLSEVMRLARRKRGTLVPLV